MIQISYLIFFVTVPSIEEGEKIANLLLEKKIVACVNIIKGITSIYRWKGSVHKDTEHLLIIKTTQKRSEDLIKTIENVHSYETPECVGFEIDNGSENYLKWIKEVVK
ncbi:MAG: divalent-cation tolerance protein CutA [Candidatus Lokiarchaeota archaeon]